MLLEKKIYRQSMFNDSISPSVQEKENFSALWLFRGGPTANNSEKLREETKPKVVFKQLTGRYL
jgi:hypothetical protein